MNYIVTSPFFAVAAAAAPASASAPIDHHLLELRDRFDTALANWDAFEPEYKRAGELLDARRAELAAEHPDLPLMTTHRQAEVEIGYDEIDARADALLRDITGAIHEIEDTPASTVEGLAVKARVLWWYSAPAMAGAGATFSDTRSEIVRFLAEVESVAGTDSIWQARGKDHDLMHDRACERESADASLCVAVSTYRRAVRDFNDADAAVHAHPPRFTPEGFVGAPHEIWQRCHDARLALARAEDTLHRRALTIDL